MCNVYGFTVLTSPVDFLNSFQETEITTISQMMQVALSSTSFAIAKSATAKLKMKLKMLPAGFPVASVILTSSLAIDIVIEVFSSFELLILSLTLFTVQLV